jgi:hypothetical protein
MRLPDNSSWLQSVGQVILCIIAFSTYSSGQSTDSPQDEFQFYRDAGIQPLVNVDQGGDLAPGTYLVPHDIIIAKGKVLRIHAGTKILLTQNAMLVINGKLLCSGTPIAPIEFRKLDNDKYREPMDPRVETRWDGIYLPDSATLKMRNTIIADSKYGIVVSGKDVAMAFDIVRFVNNKFQNVKIGERTMKISENTPVVFNYPEQQVIFVEPAAVLNATETIQQKKGQPHATEYPQLRGAMAVCAGAGLILGAAGVYTFHKYEPLLSSANASKNETDQAHFRSLTTAGSVSGIIGGLLFGIGVAGFTWTIFF